MEVIIVIGIIIILIWLISGNRSNKSSTHNTASSSTTTSKPIDTSSTMDRYNLDIDREFDEEDWDFGEEDWEFGEEDWEFGEEDRDFGEEDRDFGEEDREFDEEDWEFEEMEIHDEAILDLYKITYLYHMTHKSNLENILQSGLLSHNKAHRRGVIQEVIADYEVNNIRRKREPIYNRSIHDYVPLYFNPTNPMLFRRKNKQNDIVIIAIDRNILLGQNVLFTDGNAASHKTSFYNSLDNLNRLNWQCINSQYWNNYQDGKRIKCAEVLVYPKIEVSSIKKIICNNQDTLNLVRTKIRAYNHIASEVNNNLYFNNSGFFYI